MIMYGKTSNVSISKHKMSDRKNHFCSKIAVKKLFRATVVNADTGSLKSLHTLFDTHLDYVLAKFKPNRMVRIIQNFELFSRN